MPPSGGSTQERGAVGVGHGLLYCVASLVLGIELNIVGPTASSLAAQVGVNESALGGVVGLGGIGLLVGGIPAGWLLDKLPGHTVLASATALQAFTFCLLPHCTHLAVLAATYCAAALTFNAITTGANALILWRYPATQGAWLNLASALFGVGCFLAPVLADMASRKPGGGGGPPSAGPAGSGAGLGDEGGVGDVPFALRGGAAALAYYAVAAGAAACTVWALCLPSPPRPDPHAHHHRTPQDQDQDPQQHADGGGAAATHGGRVWGQPQAKAQLGSAVSGRGGASSSGGDSGASGSGSPALPRSPSFASVLDMTGLDCSSGDSPEVTTDGHQLPANYLGGAQSSCLVIAEATGCVDPVDAIHTAMTAQPAEISTAAMAAAVAPATTTGSTPGSSRTSVTDWFSCSSGATPSDDVSVLAASAAAGCATAAAAAAVGAADVPGSSGSGGGSDSCTGCGFGSTLSLSPGSVGAVDGMSAAAAAATGGDCRLRSNPLYGISSACTSGGDAGGVSGGGAATDAADVLSAAAAQIQLIQQQEQEQRRQQHCSQQQVPAQGSRRRQENAVAAAPSAAGGVAAAAAPPPAGKATAAQCRTRTGGTAALFRRYLHELRLGWPVLLPVVVLLFANISTQASFGAWVTTYCRLAAGLDESAAQSVTAAYWAAFTGTRLAGVAVAPLLHASSVLLITSPFAVAGAAMAVVGLPHIPGLVPSASAAAAAAAAAASATEGAGGAAAFAAGLPSWALYTAVCLVGVGVATGFANTVSLTGDHLRLDGFTNGVLSSVAGLASTLCPAAVPWLAEHTGMGYGALMVVALAMSGVQMVMVLAANVGARWVDEWQRREDEEEEAGEGSGAPAVVEVVVGGERAEAGGRRKEVPRGAAGELRVPLLASGED